MALLMALVMVAALCACKKNEDKPDAGSTTTTTTTTTDISKTATTDTTTPATTDTTTPDTTEPAGTDTTGTTEVNPDLIFDVTVWVPENAVELTEKQIEDFNNTNSEGIMFFATVEAVSEADAATTMITDVESGADIYFFAQDQTARLIQSGALSKLGPEAKDAITAANSAGSIAAVTSGEDLYAYPLTADNGYFMYYDKSVIPDADVDSLTALIADCEAAGRNFCMELDTSAWYCASFFFGTGCVSEWITDDDGNFISINDTFNSDKGLAAAKGIYELITSPIHVSSSAGAEFESAIPAAIVVTGTWDYDTVKGILGDNMGVADLPSFTADGKTYHLGSFNGCKLLGVKPQTDATKAAALNLLAQYLTGENAQLERFNAVSWGPSNLNAQASDAVKANPGLIALAQQDAYAVPQGQIHGSWWDIGKVIATDIKESDGTDEGLKQALQNYEDTCAALFNMTTDEKEAWSVIGGICGTNWDADFAMTRTAETGDATFYSDALLLNQGEELKARQGASWDVNFGGDGARDGGNLAVPETGYYFVKLVVNEDLTSASLTLEKTSFFEWAAIGTLNGTNWDTDFEMSVQDDGTTYKLEGVEMAAGIEFKVRKSHGWDINFGANGEAGGANIVVEADGTYTIVFDSLTGMITLE